MVVWRVSVDGIDVVSNILCDGVMVMLCYFPILSFFMSEYFLIVPSIGSAS